MRGYSIENIWEDCSEKVTFVLIHEKPVNILVLSEKAYFFPKIFNKMINFMKHT